MRRVTKNMLATYVNEAIFYPDNFYLILNGDERATKILTIGLAPPLLWPLSQEPEAGHDDDL